MPRGVHTSKRPSGWQQRQAKKAKLEELQKMSCSFHKYVIKIDDNQTSSKVTDNLNSADRKHVSDNCSTCTKNGREEEEDEMIISENDESVVAEIDKDNTSNDDNLNKSINLQKQEKREEVEMMLPEKDENVGAEIDKENVMKDNNLNKSNNLEQREEEVEMMLPGKNESEDVEMNKDNNISKSNNLQTREKAEVEMILTEKDECVDAEIDKSDAKNDNLNKSINLQKREEEVEMTLPEKKESEDAEMYEDNARKDDNLNKSINIKKRQEDEDITILPEKNESEDAEMDKENTIKYENLNASINLQIVSDISHWNIPISDNIRVDIVTKGSHHFQNKEGPFGTSMRPGINSKGETRRLSKEWFYKEMANGEKILRSWMVYSPTTNNLYCFCCRLFASSCTDTTSAFVNGFRKWWKLNPKVIEHEVSNEHLQNLEKWKTLETRLRFHSTIDHTTVKLMNAEKKKWKELLTRLLEITLFLAKQNLPFRGHDESNTSANKGNFLELVQLLSKYDAVLREHLLNLENSSPKVSYLSPDVQNEFISVLSSYVKCKLVEEIKSAVYFGMMFDSTPDVSHTDQMSQVIRYVKIEDRKVEIKEAFLGFFPLKGKKASDLSEEIFKKLNDDGLDIMMCRSQGYDNAATMSGIHGGVQAIIKSKNKKAVFFGCINHSLNLCGQNSFAQNVSCVTFFGTLEAVFLFFSASTNRWEVLVKHSKITVKRVSTTRWSAHYAAVKVMAEKFDEVTAAIEELCDSRENLDTRGAAQSLLPALLNFTFLCYLFFWSDVLREVNCTQVSLQAKTLSLDESIIKLETLRLYIFEKRIQIVERAIENSLKLCEDYDIPIERRIRRKKKMAGEQARDEGLSVQDENRKNMLECLDRLHSEMQTRSHAVQDVAERFEALKTNNLLMASEEDLKILVPKLTSFYDEVSEKEICLEIPRLRRHLKAANVDNLKTINWVALDFLKFIVEWDFIESIPNLFLSLKLFLTICVSVASCERSFSKMKLIKNYLRSTMSDSRLSNLAMLTIEHEVTQNIDFDEIITNFASMKARKGKF